MTTITQVIYLGVTLDFEIGKTGAAKAPVT
jgi:hypothetical protein